MPAVQPIKPTLSSQPNFNQLELDVLAYWDAAQVHQLQSEQNKSGAVFTVFDGPPTANANPGIHHMLPTAFKDAAMRYKSLRGMQVARQYGWDTHGLPVEVQVEKALGLQGKMDVLTLVPGDEQASIEAFNKACKSSVWTAKEAWDEFLRRTGRWSDPIPYITYEPEYIDGVWGVLKKVWDKGLVYKDYKVVPHCPRCGTTLSSAEVAQGYIDVSDRTVYVKFRISDQKSRFLVAWTTTPWTLPGNVALAVGEDIAYAVVLQNGEELVVAEALVEKMFGPEAHLVSRLSGKDLIGLTYEPLFAGVMDDQSGERYTVVVADFVTTTDGTGIVHTACMYGEDDFRLGKEAGLTMYHTVDQSGVFMDHTPFAGISVFEATEKIIAQLEENDALVREERYTHSYPHCWRCKTPLLYYAKDSWYIAVSSLRSELIAANKAVTWIPEHIQDGRFGDFIAEARDWAISRERFWGTPLPIWRSESGKSICVGSRAELAALAGGDVLSDPHRPYVDDISFEFEGEQYHREPYVMDVWFDSGAMPWASSKVASGHFPADYIAEAVDQTRGWFYSLLVLGVICEGQSPYKAVTCMGHFMDTAGRKMSKSLGNILKPMEVYERTGADAARWYAYTVNAPGESKAIGVDEIVQTARKVFVPLWNMAGYLQTHASESMHEYVPVAELQSSNALDTWVMALHGDVINRVTKSYEEYDFTRAGRYLENYITELSTWYLRRSRKREDLDFGKTFFAVLQEVAVMMAPLAPMLSDALFLAIRSDSQPQSVHLMRWPVVPTFSESVLADMELARKVVELGLQVRASEGIKLRQPLSKALVRGVTLSDELLQIVAEELNVLQVEIGSDDTQPSASLNGMVVALDTTLTDELRVAGTLRDLTRHLQQLRKTSGLSPVDMARILVEPEDMPRFTELLSHDAELLVRINLILDDKSEVPGQISEIPLGAEAVARVSLQKI